MSKDRARESVVAQERLSAAFSAAIMEMKSLRIGAERTRHLRGLATLLVGQTEAFKAAAILQCPDLAAAQPFPDTLLSPEEHELVSQLTQSDLDVVDQALLRGCASTWRKVPRVIGGAMVCLEGRFPGLSLGLYVRRIGSLVASGKLLAKGNVEFIRLGEVRVPSVGKSVP
jgi:hypothetical protein